MGFANRFSPPASVARSASRRAVAAAAVAFAWVLGSCGRDNPAGESVGETTSGEGGAALPGASDDPIGAIITSEELILELTPKLGALSSWLAGGGDGAPPAIIAGGLRVAGVPSALEFAEGFGEPGGAWAGSRRVRVGDLVVPAPDTEAGREAAASPSIAAFLGAMVDGWRPETVRLQAVRALEPWTGGTRFRMEVGLDARLVRERGAPTAREDPFVLRAVHAEGEAEWRYDAGSDDGDAAGGWRLAVWRPRLVRVAESDGPFFEEVLRKALPDDADYQRARFSYHEQNLIDFFTKDEFKLRKAIHGKYPDFDSTFQHPSVSVVDLDRDGHDDLHVTGRWGRNQLLRNQGDGTFRDIASSIGLDVEGQTDCAVFADFDNDGDHDVFLGRILERSLLLENEDGSFVDRSGSWSAVPLPFLVATAAAADYNGDGLLDLYLGLYGPTGKGHPVSQWAPDFFPEAMQAELERRSEGRNPYLDRFGPPNLLLVNRGGRFEVAPESEGLAEWSNTNQAAWCDFDRDGDPDLYVCNDFAPDHLYRNEGRGGNGIVRFTEVSGELAGTAMSGFGMGASWADYNRDGRLDLYVSNMFSKAGRRITGQIEGLDARVPHSAFGNLLFENTEGGFRQVAGLTPDTVMVAKVGWSYGGQFADFDNDGWLDLYCPSGFYTAPVEIASEGDL